MKLAIEPQKISFMHQLYDILVRGLHKYAGPHKYESLLYFIKDWLHGWENLLFSSSPGSKFKLQYKVDFKVMLPYRGVDLIEDKLYVCLPRNSLDLFIDFFSLVFYFLFLKFLFLYSIMWFIEYIPLIISQTSRRLILYGCFRASFRIFNASLTCPLIALHSIRHYTNHTYYDFLLEPMPNTIHLT